MIKKLEEVLNENPTLTLEQINLIARILTWEIESKRLKNWKTMKQNAYFYKNVIEFKCWKKSTRFEMLGIIMLMGFFNIWGEKNLIFLDRCGYNIYTHKELMEDQGKALQDHLMKPHKEILIYLKYLQSILVLFTKTFNGKLWKKKQQIYHILEVYQHDFILLYDNVIAHRFKKQRNQMIQIVY